MVVNSYKQGTAIVKVTNVYTLKEVMKVNKYQKLAHEIIDEVETAIEGLYPDLKRKDFDNAGIEKNNLAVINGEAYYLLEDEIANRIRKFAKKTITKKEGIQMRKRTELLCPFCKGNRFERTTYEEVRMMDNGENITDEIIETPKGYLFRCLKCGKDVTNVELTREDFLKRKKIFNK